MRPFPGQQACDESGLAAALLQHAPAEFFVFCNMETPQLDGRCFQRRPAQNLQLTDFRPIANIRVFFKVFAYMILARMEQSLERFQLESQHGFRSGRRMEEHVLTTKVILDKS